MTSTPQVSVGVSNAKQSLERHAQLSSLTQHFRPAHVRCCGALGTSPQKHPSDVALHESGRHEHSSPGAGQPFGAQQSVGR
jgi:hypothetical protein